MPEPSIRRRLAALTIGALCAALSFPVSAAADTDARVLGAGAPDAIADQYIVALSTSALDRTAIDDLAADYHGTVAHTYTTSFHGFSTTMDYTDALRLAADPAVKYVEAVRRVQANGVQTDPPNRGLDRIDQRDLPLDQRFAYPDTAGGDSRIFVIDTGIRLSHKDFGGRAISGHDFVDDDGDASDCNGHGTHMAGVAAGEAHGVAKKAELVAVRVLDCNGSGSTADVIAGVDWVTNTVLSSPANIPSVVNFSLGGGASIALDDAVANSIQLAGVSYSISAGSSATDACGFSPGRVPTAVTVGGTVTDTDARHSPSNIGPCLDLFAPASNIVSAWHTSDDAVQTLSGTSTAAADVSGALALYRTIHPTATPAQAAQGLVDNATADHIPDPGKESPNLILYTGFMN